MMEFQDTVSLGEVAHPLLGLLLDVALKGALVLAFAGLLTTLFRRLTSSLRHLVWGLAFGSILILPILSFFLPAWQIPVLPTVPFLSAPTESPPVTDFSLSSAPLPAVSREVAPATAPPSSNVFQAEATGRLGTRREVAHADTLEELVADTAVSWKDRIAGWPWYVWAFWIWAAGVAVTLMRFVIGSAGIWWLSRRARPVIDRAWHRINREVADQLLLTRKVRLLRSPRTAMPMTWGFYHPIVMLPVSANAWSPARRRCVLLHEFAHIKRWDCLTQALVQIACAFNWFNPLVWYAARQMRIEREKACDDVVLARGTKASEYASHLLEIARSTRSSFVVPFGAVAMAGRSQLERRVMSILDSRRGRRQTDGVTRMLGVVMTALLIVPLAILHPVSSQQGVLFDPDHIDLETRFVPASVHAHGESILHEIEGQTTWSAKVRAGQTIEVKGIRGTIDARPASSDKVEVFMTSAGGSAQEVVKIIHHAQGVTFCMPYPGLGQECGEDALPPRYTTRPTEVDFLVRLPRGVHLVARTAQGTIQATGLFSNVQAATIDGDVIVQSYGRVWAESVTGNIGLWTNTFGGGRTVEGNFFAKMGQTRWHGTLPISSVKGDITVSLPAQADADVDLRMESSGQLTSSIFLQGDADSAGGRFMGRLGAGGRVLALHSTEGDISIIGADRRVFRPYRSIEVEAPEDHRRADAIPKLAHYTAPPLLATAFDEQDRATRVVLLHRFAVEDENDIVLALGEVLARDPFLEVRREAAKVLGQLACRDGLPTLLVGLEDGSAEVRREVARALYQAGDPRSIQPLAHQLRWETDFDTRQEITRSLEEMAPNHPVLHHAELFPSLEVATTDREVAIRHGAFDFAFTTGLVDVLKKAFSGLDLGQYVAESDVHAAMNLVLEEEESTYEQDMRALQLGPLSKEDLILARLVGVDPDYIRDVRTVGYCPTLDEFVRLKVAGVDQGFLQKTAGAGYYDLPVDALITLRLESDVAEGAGVPASSKRNEVDEQYTMRRFGPHP